MGCGLGERWTDRGKFVVAISSPDSNLISLINDTSSNQALDSYLTTNATSTSTATPSYDPSAAYTYTGLQTRYFTVWSSYVLPVLLEATGTAGGIVNTALQSVYPNRSGFDDARRSVLANPTGATFENVSPMPFTVRVLVSFVRFEGW
jgi:hypothetical protein